MNKDDLPDDLKLFVEETSEFYAKAMNAKSPRFEFATKEDGTFQGNETDELVRMAACATHVEARCQQWKKEAGAAYLRGIANERERCVAILLYHLEACRQMLRGDADEWLENALSAIRFPRAGTLDAAIEKGIEHVKDSPKWARGGITLSENFKQPAKEGT